MSPKIRRLGVFLVLTVAVVTVLTNLGYRPRWLMTTPAQLAAMGEPVSIFKSVPWAKIQPKNPVASMIPLPTGAGPAIPQIQVTQPHVKEESAVRRKRQQAAVKEAFMFSWKGYKKNAWLHDEVQPMSGGSHDPFGAWGASLVDSLDTLLIMGLDNEFEAALRALDKINFSRCSLAQLNVFETTIRYLGGFLGAYDVSNGKYPKLLEKATEVGEMLYHAFDTPNRMPISRWTWADVPAGKHQAGSSNALVAELGSLSLEFTRLTQLTGDPKYFDAIQRVMNVFAREQNKTKIPGLWPVFINPSAKIFSADNSFTLGGMADSTYEYLPKQYLLMNGLDSSYQQMYHTALAAVKDYLVFEPLIDPADFNAADPPTRGSRTQVLTPLILGSAHASGSIEDLSLDNSGQHLTCFAGGMIALAARAFSDIRVVGTSLEEDMGLAKRLVEGCVWSYRSTPTGVGPEIFVAATCRQGRDAVTSGASPDWRGRKGNCTWDEEAWATHVRNQHGHNTDAFRTQTDFDGFIKRTKLAKGMTDVLDSRYILRPEAIESIFVLYRITGEQKYRDQAWDMFESITRYTRAKFGYASIANVMETPIVDHEGEGGSLQLIDSMESFWMAETLKYFYLIFAEPDVISLDEFVFNTEAHPLRWRKWKNA